MAIKLELIDCDDFVHCILSGAHTVLDEFIEPFSEILRLCREKEISKCLFDYRQFESYPKPGDKISIFEIWNDRYSTYLKFGGNEITVALLLAEDQLDGVEVPLNTVKNSGINICRTTELQNAVDWLAAN